MLCTGPEECLSHTNPECRCSDRQTRMCSEEKAEQRGRDSVRQAGEREEREGRRFRDLPFIIPGRRVGRRPEATRCHPNRALSLDPGPALHRTSRPCSGDWTRVVSVPHARSGHPRQAAVGAVKVLGPSTRSECPGCAARSFGGKLHRCGGVWRHEVIFPVCGRCWWLRW